MANRSKLSPEMKKLAMLRYEKGTESLEKIAKDIGASPKSIRNWQRLYESFGEDGLRGWTSPTFHNKEFKRRVVEEYLEGTKSQDEICRIFKIRSARTVQIWLEEYNRGELGSKSLKNESPLEEVLLQRKATPGGRQNMLVSHELKLEIVSSCIANGHSYQLTAEEYGLTYSKVYNWVKNYEKLGEKGLIDKRGRPKHAEQMSDVDVLKAELRILRAENRRKDTEIEALKKAWRAGRGRSV